MKKRNAHKILGGCIGAVFGFIAALQFAMNRMFLWGELGPAECAGESCAFYAISSFVLWMVLGWIAGAYIQSRFSK